LPVENYNDYAFVGLRINKEFLKPPSTFSLMRLACESVEEECPRRDWLPYAYRDGVLVLRTLTTSH
jgi:hypothetical protein